MRPTKSVSEMSRKMSKAEISARQEMEAKVVSNQTTPKASPLLNPAERKIFNKLKKRNDNFTESDSESLNMLTQYLHRYNVLKTVLDDLDPLDAQAYELERRIIAIDKQINQHMIALCLPLSQRLRMANDMAKVMIEEKKLEQMSAENKQEVNPIYKLLEDIKEMENE
ncbi:MAG: hypothetical protein WAM95_06110 [Bacillus sp. (in: firmicutes)]